MTILTWNIEGFSRNFHSLRHFTDKFRPMLVFLTETMIFQSDLPPLIKIFNNVYEFELNSVDLYDMDLPCQKSSCHGGTMVMWHSSFNGYIKVLPASSPAFQTILLKYPHVVPSLHTVIYLPTAGNDEKYVSVLSQLKEHVDAIRIEYPGVPHFVRGDANSNSKNTMRHNLLSHFSGEYSFERIPLNHPSYHHFVGDGLFDSEIDVILVHASVDSASEVLLQIICKLENLLIDSHHE